MLLTFHRVVVSLFYIDDMIISGTVVSINQYYPQRDHPSCHAHPEAYEWSAVSVAIVNPTSTTIAALV